MTGASYDLGQLRFFEDWTRGDVLASGEARLNEILRGTLAQAVQAIGVPPEFARTWSREWREACAEFERGYNDARSQNE